MATFVDISRGDVHAFKRPRLDFESTAVVPRPMAQYYVEQQLNKRPAEPEKPNHVLLFTVLNPTYPITCPVLHTVCSPLGAVVRIVIFRKNGVQAMVEFESVEAAAKAKLALHGCDIYSECCTLKVEFAKPPKLNVYKNDSDSWDYTNPVLGLGRVKKTSQSLSPTEDDPNARLRPVLLKEPMLAAAAAAAAAASINPMAGLVPRERSPDAACLNTTLDLLAATQQHAGILAANPALALSAMHRAVPSATDQAGLFTHLQSNGTVCMVYGLNMEKMSAARIFNLFCLYGNVVKVKFLKTKEGCAMVQMGDAASAERAVTNLNNCTFFGSKMQLGFSKQAFLADVPTPYALPDGSPSFQDFMGSKHNRFMNPEMATKNRIQAPAKILHFFNTPPGLTEEDLSALFSSLGLTSPNCIKVFPSKTDRSSSGLIEFDCASEAVEALVACNHHPVANPTGKFPYIMKLCFSSSRSIHTSVR